MRLSDVRIESDTPEGRAGWVFAYRAAELRRASAERAAFHRQRFERYRTEADVAETEIRAKGIELREHQVTGGAQFQAVVDPPLAAKLTDLRQRRDSHEAHAKTFQTYAGAFGAMDQDALLHLTIADVEFFGLHEKEPDT